MKDCNYSNWRVEVIDDYGEELYFCPCGHIISFLEWTNEECMTCEEEYRNENLEN